MYGIAIATTINTTSITNVLQAHGLWWTLWFICDRFRANKLGMSLLLEISVAVVTGYMHKNGCDAQPFHNHSS
jgi:hypothetical protein